MEEIVIKSSITSFYVVYVNYVDCVWYVILFAQEFRNFEWLESVGDFLCTLLPVLVRERWTARRESRNLRPDEP